MKTLPQHLQETRAPQDLQALLLTIAGICSQISAQIREGALAGIHGEAGTGNVQGEQQKKLDVIANDLFVQGLAQSKTVCGLASEEMDHAVDVPGGARLLAAFDPLDGSSNIDVNVSIGSIFSILPAPPPAASPPSPITDADFLQPGSRQLAAGYVIYGPATEMVVSTGNGVYGFTLSAQGNAWVLSRGPVKIPAETAEFAINASNARHWHPPVQQYVDELLAGKTGPRGKDFNMRWVASMVADVHRIVSRGGVFLYPADRRDTQKPGRLRILYEANPMSFIVGQAGGASINATRNMLDVQPSGLHARTAIVLGSAAEVERVRAFELAQA
jgi:fructose-1,6-bisphosphatase I